MDRDGLVERWAQLQREAPLIHCITSPIAINDCANAVLAVGARPICAEYPEEVAEITKSSNALSVSLANITEARAKSIMISGLAAKAAGISSVIDLVGIRCSAFRLALAKKYIAECKPAIIKGNASEIRTLAGERGEFHDGIDTAKQDRVSLDDPESIRDMEKILKKLAVQYRAVIMATGAVDLISDGENIFAIENGVPEMGRVTGTGCILNCLIASFLSVAEPLEAAVLAASVWGISGELGDRSRGLGTYHIELLNQLSLIDGKRIKEYAKIKRIEKGIGYGFS